jgi:hypothetical protein
MNKLLWAIYYEDGTRFTNLDGTPDEAPFFGVIAIACVDGLWFARDRYGLMDYLQMPGMIKCVKMGRITTNKKYNFAAGWARADQDLPPNRTIEEGEDFYVWMGK